MCLSPKGAKYEELTVSVAFCEERESSAYSYENKPAIITYYLLLIAERKLRSFFEHLRSFQTEMITINVYT